VPFWYSLSQEGHANGTTILRPIGDMAAWSGDYRYTLGDALFVAPILDGTGKRDVVLPAGARYYDFWAPDSNPIDGGMTVAPGWGDRPLAKPCSPGLFALKGIALAMSPVCAALATAGSADEPGPFEGPLSVLRAAALAALSLLYLSSLKKGSLTTARAV